MKRLLDICAYGVLISPLVIVTGTIGWTVGWGFVALLLYIALLCWALNRLTLS